MGLFDLFKGTPKAGGQPRPKASPASKWADRVERRVQNYDRQEAIQALSEMGTADAVQVLLKRFTFHMDPSITDQEEKDAAFRGILRAGRDAIEPVRAFAARAESLAWPMKIIKALVDEGEYTEELLRWLSKWDTDYAKFVDPKVQLLVALEEVRDPRIREGVERFLEDVNEPARFHAASTLVAQGDAEAVGALSKLIIEEESVRVRTKVTEGLAARAWPIPEDTRSAVRNVLPAGYTLDGAGRVTKR
jgi:HEAT repeat protein